jgi:deoxycytidylate deaminase
MPADAERTAAWQRPELVFGLIGPIGSDLGQVRTVLESSLSRFGYRTRLVRVTDEMRKLPYRPWNKLPDPESLTEDQRYDVYMDAGDALRSLLRRDDAVLYPALLGLQNNRLYLTGSHERPAFATAYVIHSLKTPGEVLSLRFLYGRRFVAMAAYSPRELRKDRLSNRIAMSHRINKQEEHVGRAEVLVLRDERGHGDDKFGQRAAETYSLSDVIVDASSDERLEADVERFLNLLFGHPYTTPRMEELGMAFAHTAALQSSSMARQVGASIFDERGGHLASGCNEVPKFGGQFYWPGDVPDSRDFQLGRDVGVGMRENVLANTLSNLIKAGWRPPHSTEPDRSGLENRGAALTDEQVRVLVEEQLQFLASEGDEREGPRLRRNLIQDLIEFVRAVHAEMACLCDAVRRGVSVRGGTLYGTTFPCHECARHLIAAGISRVVYLEPYPKSLVFEFYREETEFDPPAGRKTDRVRFEPFRGITPVRFSELFR